MYISILSSHGRSVSRKVAGGSANLCLLTFQRWRRDLGILHRSWLTDGNPLCGWATATSHTSTWSELTKGVVCARSVRRIAEHSWSEENLRAVVETPQRLKTTIAEIPPAAEPLALPHEPPEAAGDAKEEPTGEQEEDDEMQGGPVGTREAPGTSSSGRGEKRTETIDDEITEKRPATSDDPVKRRLLKKTDLQSSDVLMAVEINDTDLLHTVNTLLNDETGEREKPWSEGKAEGAELTERNGSHGNCETV